MNRQLSPQETAVVDGFRSNFGTLAGETVFIYGIGVFTRLLLQEIPDLNVQGLLDPGAIGQSVFGLPVVSLDEAIAANPDRIIIVARESATRIVRRRIAADCAAAGIPVFDLQGQLLGEPTAESPIEDPYWELTQASVKAQIEAAESVSFDIFDTLVTRTTLFPRDPWEIVAETAVSLGVDDFFGLRAKAESDVASMAEPALGLIYERLSEIGSVAPEVALELRELELATEKKLLIRRDAVVELLDYAVSLGRPVTLVSDMYLPESFLREVLDDLGITGYGQLLVSGDQGRAKHSGIFDLLERPGDGPHVHIGDNAEADGNCAAAAGLTPVIIRSGLDMLLTSPAATLLSAASDLSSKLVLGLGIATVFNDPFVTSTTQGRIPIRGARDLTWMILAPLMTSMAVWLAEEAHRAELDALLLAARDGFLIEKLYARTLEARREQGLSTEGYPEATYFLTSRLAATLTSIRTADDVTSVASLPYSGGGRALLEERFLLDPGVIEGRASAEQTEEFVIAHADEIVERAAQARANYFEYAQNLGVTDHSAIGFFDFVSRGSAQLGTEALLNQSLLGLYCVHVHDPREDRQNLRVISRQSLEHENIRQGGLNATYLFVENFLSSPMPTVKSFGPGGEPEYAPEWRNPAQIATMLNVQDEVLAYFDTWLSLRPRHVHQPVSSALTDALLDLLDARIVAFAPGLFDDHLLVDEFINVSSPWLNILGHSH